MAFNDLRLISIPHCFTNKHISTKLNIQGALVDCFLDGKKAAFGQFPFRCQSFFNFEGVLVDEIWGGMAVALGHFHFCTESSLIAFG